MRVLTKGTTLSRLSVLIGLLLTLGMLLSALFLLRTEKFSSMLVTVFKKLGTNATANQSGDTAKTFSVKAADNTIIVSANGIRVNSNGLPNFSANGDIILGDGCGTSTLTINAETTLSCDMVPTTDIAINLGSAAKRFANIYTGDLHLKNDRGDWTLIEEEDCLTMRNNKTGKRYAISMTPYEG